MYTDVPASVEITDEIILYWDEPDSNGAAITRYSIYQRVGNEWKLIGVINDISKREYVVEIEKGKVYEFVVTATNKYGESSLEENIKWIQALSGTVKSKQPKRIPLSWFIWLGLREPSVTIHGVKRQQGAPSYAEISPVWFQGHPTRI